MMMRFEIQSSIELIFWHRMERSRRLHAKHRVDFLLESSTIGSEYGVIHVKNEIEIHETCIENTAREFFKYL